MSYYSELKKLIAEGHDPDTSSEVAALRKDAIKLYYGGNDKVNVSTVGSTISRTAMFDEDKRELDWYVNHMKQQENFEKYGASLEDKKIKQ